MNYFRIYTDSDGESHFEDIDITMHMQPNVSAGAGRYVFLKKAPKSARISCLAR